jgi:hypothetical protein
MRLPARPSRSLVLGFACAQLCAGCGGAATLAEPLGYADPIAAEGASHRSSAVWGSGPHTLRSAVSFDRRLWLLTGDDRLSAIRLDDDAIESFDLGGERVVDLRRTGDNRLWALAYDEATGDTRVWEREATEWVPIFELMTASEPLALGELASRPVVVTRRALVWVDADSVESEAFSPAIDTSTAQRVHVTTIARKVYVGLDAGRGGGGLLFADLDRHTTSWVEAREGLEGCAGTFDPACERVTGLATHPEATGCALVGLMRAREQEGDRDGRLLRVCGTEVERVSGVFDDFDAASDPSLALAAFHGTPADGAAPAPDGAAPADIDPRADDDLFGGLPTPSDGAGSLSFDPTGGVDTKVIRLCAIDPSACAPSGLGFDDPREPTIVAVADAPGGAWLATRGRLVFWSRRGALSSALPAPKKIADASVFARADVVWAAPFDATTTRDALLAVPANVLAAGGASAAVDSGDAPRGCYRAFGDAGVELCFTETSYVMRDRDGVDAADYVPWKRTSRQPRLGRELVLPGKQSVRVSVSEDGSRLTVLRDVDHRVVSAELGRLDEVETRELRDELGDVPSAAEVCARARACVRSLPEGDWDPSSVQTDVTTLRACELTIEHAKRIGPKDPAVCEE